MVAEELCVPLERVKLLYCDTSITPDQAHTSGSQSHPANFNHGNLALAGATAREALLRLASQRLNVPVERLVAAAGVIAVKGDPSKKIEDIENVEIVFKDGVGYDSGKLIESVRGKVGLR